MAVGNLITRGGPAVSSQAKIAFLVTHGLSLPVISTGGKIKRRKQWRTLPNGLKVETDDATYQTLLARYDSARKPKTIDEIVAALEPRISAPKPKLLVVAPPTSETPLPPPIPFDPEAQRLIEQRLAYQRGLVADEDKLILQVLLGDARPVNAAHIDDEDSLIIRLLLGDHPAQPAPQTGDDDGKA